MSLNKPVSDQITFEGEEAGTGHAAPRLDLIAAGFLIALAILVIVASLTLPVPGAMRTAPGLLPFLTAASLLVMAVLLGLSALSRHRAGAVADPADTRNWAEDQRALILAVTIALYIAALQVLAFQAFFSIAEIPLVLSAFEPVTVLALATIIQLSWRGALWITVAVSGGWTLTLSLVFQKIFQIPLPGGF